MTKLHTFNIIMEMERVYCQIPESAIPVCKFKINSKTLGFYKQAVAERTKNPVFLDSYNFYGTPILVDDSIPDDTIICQ